MKQINFVVLIIFASGIYSIKAGSLDIFFGHWFQNTQVVGNDIQAELKPAGMHPKIMFDADKFERIPKTGSFLFPKDRPFEIFVRNYGISVRMENIDKTTLWVFCSSGVNDQTEVVSPKKFGGLKIIDNAIVELSNEDAKTAFFRLQSEKPIKALAIKSE